jgi:hypothetical protein
MPDPAVGWPGPDTHLALAARITRYHIEYVRRQARGVSTSGLAELGSGCYRRTSNFRTSSSESFESEDPVRPASAEARIQLGITRHHDLVWQATPGFRVTLWVNLGINHSLIRTPVDAGRGLRASALVPPGNAGLAGLDLLVPCRCPTSASCWSSMTPTTRASTNDKLANILVFIFLVTVVIAAVTAIPLLIWTRMGQ